MAFLAAVENSALATWVRDSPSLWAFPSIMFFHTVGLALLVGLNVAIDLRVLGCARRVPLAPLERFYGLMWLGFWLNVVTGAMLLAAHATTRALDPLFYTKLACIAAAMAALIAIRRVVFGSGIAVVEPLAPRARGLAAASLVLWFGAIAAARVMVYLGQAVTG
jgi:hypothetical protein